jgi:hypothetical protein
MDLSEFDYDRRLAEEGVWVPLDATTSLRLARLGNPRFRAALAREQEPYRLALRAGTLDEAAQERIMVRALAEGVLLDWRGMSQGGTELAYSTSEAERVLASFPDFRELVVKLAGMRRWYREAEIEDAKKNSVGASRGS